MQGCHRHMGDVWSPDRPVAMPEALEVQRVLEKDWKTFERDPEGRLKTALTGVLVTCGLGGGMWGEEINRMDVGIIHKHWDEGRTHNVKLVSRLPRSLGICSMWILAPCTACREISPPSGGEGMLYSVDTQTYQPLWEDRALRRHRESPPMTDGHKKSNNPTRKRRLFAFWPAHRRRRNLGETKTRNTRRMTTTFLSSFFCPRSLKVES
jgi:hypothetical protein